MRSGTFAHSFGTAHSKQQLSLLLSLHSRLPILLPAILLSLMLRNAGIPIDVADALLHVALSVEAPLLDADRGLDLPLLVARRICCTRLVGSLLLSDIFLLLPIPVYSQGVRAVRLVSCHSSFVFSPASLPDYLLMVVAMN